VVTQRAPWSYQPPPTVAQRLRNAGDDRSFSEDHRALLRHAADAIEALEMTIHDSEKQREAGEWR